MLKPVVFMLSMVLGGAATLLAVSVQRDRMTLTGAPMPPLERTTEALVRVQSSLPAADEVALVSMDEVVIRAERTARARAAPQVEKETTFQPCSEWRDLGPKALADSLDTDQHRVRALCPRP